MFNLKESLNKLQKDIKEVNNKIRDGISEFKVEDFKEDIKNKIQETKDIINNINDVTPEIKKEIIDSIVFEDNDLKKSIYLAISNYLKLNENFDLNEIFLGMEGGEFTFEKLELIFNGYDMNIIKKCYITEDLSELTKLNYKNTSKVNQIKSNVNKNIKSNIPIKVNYNLNYRNALFLFSKMEEILREQLNIEDNEDNINNRDEAFFKAIKIFVEEKFFLESFFLIKNKVDNGENLNILLEEINIFSEDVYEIFVKNEAINRKSDFFLISHFLEQQIDKIEKKIFK